MEDDGNPSLLTVERVRVGCFGQYEIKRGLPNDSKMIKINIELNDSLLTFLLSYPLKCDQLSYKVERFMITGLNVCLCIEKNYSM